MLKLFDYFPLHKWKLKETYIYEVESVPQPSSELFRTKIHHAFGENVFCGNPPGIILECH